MMREKEVGRNGIALPVIEEWMSRVYHGLRAYTEGVCVKIVCSWKMNDVKWAYLDGLGIRK